MLGINELGYDRNVSYKRYAELVEHIRELQPDAWIVLEANLHVTQAQSEKDDIFNNENINQVNENIRQLAQENGLGYLDANVLFDDENGCLKADYSADGAHVLGSYYVTGLRGSYRNYSPAMPIIGSQTFANSCKILRDGVFYIGIYDNGGLKIAGF